MPALRGASSRKVSIRSDAILVHFGAPNPEPVRRSGREGITACSGMHRTSRPRMPSSPALPRMRCTAAVADNAAPASRGRNGLVDIVVTLGTR